MYVHTYPYKILLTLVSPSLHDSQIACFLLQELYTLFDKESCHDDSISKSQSPTYATEPV